MIYIRGGHGNPDDYDRKFAEKLKAILDESSEENAPCYEEKEVLNEQR